MKNKNILIAGGGGFIGSHLAKELVKQGNYVRVADIKYDDYLKDYYQYLMPKTQVIIILIAQFQKKFMSSSAMILYPASSG